MRALLIGGTGPTGPLVVDGLLSRGMDVTVLNRGGRALHRGADVEHVVADPHFEDSLGPALANRTFDVAIASYGRLRIMPPILAACTERVVTVGGTAYADTGGRPADENTPRALGNKLVRRIVETEAILAAAHQDGLFSHTHLRFPLLWGPRQLAPKEWSIARRVRDGRPFIPVVGGGRTIESKCYVANAAHAILLAIERPGPSAGRTYNVADRESPDDATRLRDLCTALGAPQMGILDLPEAVTGPAAFWAVGRDLDYAQEQRPPRSNHQVVASERIRRELGFEDQVGYQQAVRSTALDFIANPLPEGGEQERKLGDPFDYDAEDAYDQALRRFFDAAKDIPLRPTSYVHQYDHPSR